MGRKPRFWVKVFYACIYTLDAMVFISEQEDK